MYPASSAGYITLDRMTPVQLELLKGVFTLLAVGLGSGIGFFAYFRQKEYELTKQRYLEEGVDVVAAELQNAQGVVSHNFARALQLCRQYRDLGSHFDKEELSRGFLELDKSKFVQTANYRVGSLIGDQIIWESFQSALAHAASANAFMSQEIPDAMRILSESPEGARDRSDDARRIIDDLRDNHDAAFRYGVLGRELHVLSVLLEGTRMSKKAVAKFRDRSDVRELVQKLRVTYAEAENAA